MKVMGAARISSTARQVLLLAASAFACAAIPLSTSPASAAQVEPYGTNDAGAFRTFPRAGENGLDSSTQLAEFELAHPSPPHFADQLPLYANLLYASPTLTHAQIPEYFKDAT